MNKFRILRVILVFFFLLPLFNCIKAQTEVVNIIIIESGSNNLSEGQVPYNRYNQGNLANNQNRAQAPSCTQRCSCLQTQLRYPNSYNNRRIIGNEGSFALGVGAGILGSAIVRNGRLPSRYGRNGRRGRLFR